MPLFQYNNQLFVINSHWGIKPTNNPLQLTNIYIFYFSYNKAAILNNLPLCELSPHKIYSFIVVDPDDLSKNMYKKVFIIPLIFLLAGGIIVTLVFIVKETGSAPMDVEQQLSTDQTDLNWKIWRSSDFGPDCDSDPYCYDPLSYNLGVEFKYPPEFTPHGYRDKGGGLWFSYINHDNTKDSIAIDCTTQAQSKLVEWLYPRAFEYHEYTFIEKKDIEIGGYQGVEAIFAVTGTSPVVSHRRFEDRLIRLSIDGHDKVCEIQAPVNLDRNIIEEIISSIKISSCKGCMSE